LKWLINDQSYVVRDLSDLDRIPHNQLNPNEVQAFELLKEWFSKGEMSFHTSGSTGVRKDIYLSGELIRWSVARTTQILGNTSFNALVAIPVDKIGGAMLVLRALLNEWVIRICEPSSDPMIILTSDHPHNLTSLVPFQFFKILEKEKSSQKLQRFNKVLLGGEPISLKKELIIKSWLEKSRTEIFHTYGMTESASHIAIRKIGERDYTPFDGVQLFQDSEGHLGFRIDELDLELQTQDLVELSDQNTFLFKGRSPFIVNSAGLKIQIEELENRIELIPNIPQEGEIVLWKEPDPELGERLILLTNHNTEILKVILEQHLDKFHQPKRYYKITKIIRTESGKVNRIKTYEAFNQNQK